jgi:kynurenine formamidase
MTLPPGFTEVIDLTLVMSERHPSNWPTHMPFQHKTFNWYENSESMSEINSSKQGPYATKWMLIDEHTGTHMDAPTHFIPPANSGLEFANEWGETGVDKIPLIQLMGNALVIDSAHYETEPGVSPLTQPADIQLWESHNRSIQSSDIVVFRTGWDVNYQEGIDGNAYAFDSFVLKSKPAWGAPSEESIDYLMSKNVKCIATDAPTMGPAQGGQGVHVRALGKGAVFIECLTHLNLLPQVGAYFMFLPLNILNATGSPGRAIALV